MLRLFGQSSIPNSVLSTFIYIIVIQDYNTTTKLFDHENHTVTPNASKTKEGFTFLAKQCERITLVIMLETRKFHSICDISIEFYSRVKIKSYIIPLSRRVISGNKFGNTTTATA